MSLSGTRSTSALVPIGNIEAMKGIRLSMQLWVCCDMVRNLFFVLVPLPQTARLVPLQIANSENCAQSFELVCASTTSMTCPETPITPHTETGDGESYGLALTLA